MKNCCGSSSGLLKAAVVILFFTVIIHVIGFATPFWSQRVNSNEGLWEICQNGACFNSADSPLLSSEDWYVAVQALMIISFILAVVTIVLLLLVTCCAKFSINKPLIVSAMSIALFTAAFILISIVLYGVRGKVFFESVFAEAFVVGFSYILSALAIFGFLFVALLLAIDLNNKFNEDEKEAENEDAAEKGKAENEGKGKGDNKAGSDDKAGSEGKAESNGKPETNGESKPTKPADTTVRTDNLRTETESRVPSVPEK